MRANIRTAWSRPPPRTSLYRDPLGEAASSSHPRPGPAHDLAQPDLGTRLKENCKISHKS